MLRKTIDGVRDVWAGLNTFVKVAGTVTALIGIAATGIQTYRTISTHFADRQALRDLVAVADRQLEARDYAAAWAANGKALQLAPDDEGLLAQQTRIAIRWLQNARLSDQTGPRTFAELAQPLEDVLMRRTLKVDGPARAEIEAHIGWSRFLRSRTGSAGLDVDGPVDTALRLEPGNASANAIKGFWLLWKSAADAEPRRYFDAALAGGRDTTFSDGLILAAWMNRMNADDTYAFAALDYASRIRKSGRTVDGERTAGRLVAVYTLGLRDAPYLARLSAVMPAEDHAALLAALDTGLLSEGARRDANAMRAYFLERSGGKAEARALYERVIANEPTARSAARDFAEAGLKRLPK